MRKFRFKLDKLLEYRKRQEEAAAQSLAEASFRVVEARQAVDLIAAEIGALDSARKSAQLHDDFTEVFAIAQYQTHLSVKLEEARQKLHEVELAKESARHEVIQAMTDRKAVEKLKEKALKVHLSEAAQAEQREIDDISMARHGKEVSE